MCILFITEKPEVADAIANVLGEAEKKNGFYQCGSAQVVWASGHLLELCEPHDYDPKYEKWNIDDLPIITIPWRRKPTPTGSKRLRLICDLLKNAKEVIHAGDTDAEGQLIVDEILEYANFTNNVKRVLINDNTPRLVERALSKPDDNKKYKNFSDTAVARSVGDFLYGINMTRLYTIKAQQRGIKGVFSVGRIQTPILGLIVRRDREIENHIKRFYFTIAASFSCETLNFTGSYIVSENDTSDEDGRLTNEKQVKEIIELVRNAKPLVQSVVSKPTTESPPLPFDLLSLQAEADKKFNMTPARTLEITQELRQKNLITYNRSDCRYLSDEQHSDAPLVLQAIAANFKSGALSASAEATNPSIKSKCFNSENVTAHHAIIPTEHKVPVSSLSIEHAQIYTLIARQYLLQFFPDKQSIVTEVIIDCDGMRFKCTSTEVKVTGWAAYVEKEQSTKEQNPPLSNLIPGLLPNLLSVDYKNKETAPPKPYTNASLLNDLRSIAKYVDDPHVAALLKDKDKDNKNEHGGIGTAATRHTFVPTLVSRGFVEIKSGKIRSTETGREFHDALPAIAVKPDMTALWHEQQAKIGVGDATVMAFLNDLSDSIASHIEQTKNELLTMTNSGPKCPDCGSGLNMIPGKHGEFWGCSGYPSCKSSFPNKGGKPCFEPKKQVETCEHHCQCGSKLIRRPTKKDRQKFWYGCSAFPKCKNTYFEKDGKPEIKEIENVTG